MGFSLHRAGAGAGAVAMGASGACPAPGRGCPKGHMWVQQPPQWGLSLLLASTGGTGHERGSVSSVTALFLADPQRPGRLVGVASAPQTCVEGTRGFAQGHPAQKRWCLLQARRSGSGVDSCVC